jgi:TolA-binding protein
LRIWQSILALALCASCAGGRVRDEAAVQELKGQLAMQAAQIQAQQRRIDELEVKIAAVAARADAKRTTAAPAPEKSAPSPAILPARDPRPQLKTVKLGQGRRGRRDYNPVVENAPAIPSAIALKEPDPETMEQLEEAAAVDPGIRDELDADHAFAQAVGKFNSGALQTAETELLAFAGQHPRHTAADNALYIAGLIREHDGDCQGAIALFDRIPLSYPAGDAVLPSMVEKGRCLLRMRRKQEARELFARIVREHPNGLEGESARQLLNNLDLESGRQ